MSTSTGSVSFVVQPLMRGDEGPSHETASANHHLLPQRLFQAITSNRSKSSVLSEIGQIVAEFADPLGAFYYEREGSHLSPTASELLASPTRNLPDGCHEISGTKGPDISWPNGSLKRFDVALLRFLGENEAFAH